MGGIYVFNFNLLHEIKKKVVSLHRSYNEI